MHPSSTSINPANAVGGVGAMQPLSSSQRPGALSDLGTMRPASRESLEAIQQLNQALYANATTPCTLPPNFTYADIHALLQKNPGAMIAFVNDRNEVTDMFRLDSNGEFIHTTPCDMSKATERTISNLNSIDSRLAALREKQDSARTMNAAQDVPLNDFNPVVYKPMFNTAPHSSASAGQQQRFGAASTQDSGYLSRSTHSRGAIVRPLHNGRMTAAQNPVDIQRMQSQAESQQKALDSYYRSQNAVHTFCKNALTNGKLADELSLGEVRGRSADWGHVMQAYGATDLSGRHVIKDNTRVAIQGASRGDLEKYQGNLKANLDALQKKIEDIRSRHSKDYLEEGKVPPQDEVNAASMLCDWRNQLADLGRHIDVQLSQKVEKPSLWDRFMSFFS